MTMTPRFHTNNSGYMLTGNCDCDDRPTAHSEPLRARGLVDAIKGNAKPKAKRPQRHDEPLRPRGLLS